MWVYLLKPDGLCLFSGSRGGESQGLVHPQAVAWAVTRGRGPRQGCPPPAHPSSDREAQGAYRVRLLLLLHQEHIAPQGQLCRQLLILLPQPVDDLLERHLQLPTVVREGLQPSPGRRARTVRWQTDRQTDRRGAGSPRRGSTAPRLGADLQDLLSDWQHTSARAVHGPSQQRGYTARWDEAWRPWGQQTEAVPHPGAQSRGQSFCICLWVRTALASTGGLGWHLHVWAASRSLGLRQETINTPQLSSLSCWLWSCKL